MVLAGWTLTAGTGDAGATGGLPGARVLGLVLAAAAGAGMAAVTLLSRRLGLAGASSVTVTAHRFHLTYLLAIPLWLTQDPRLPGVAEVLTLVALGLAAVAVPLYLLQVGMQRVDPMTAMAVIVTLPGMTYVVELAAGSGYDTVTLALLCLVMATAAGYALISLRRPPLAVPI